MKKRDDSSGTDLTLHLLIRLKKPLLCLMLLLVVAACKKDDIKPGLEDGKSTIIYDLAGDTGVSVGSETEGKEQRPFDIFLFRFKDKKQLWIRDAADSAKYLQTLDWDIAFTGVYNSEVFVNKGDYEYNPGYGGPANTAVVKVDRPYEDITEAPSDEEFAQSKVNKIGWAHNIDQNGWFFYSLETHIMVPIKNRIYVIRLPSGKYAKLELLSAYKGNPPTVTDLNWPAPYFTFRYYVQENGTKDLRTK